MKSIGIYKGQKGRAPNEPSKVLVYARYGNQPELCIIDNGKATTIPLTREMIINLLKDLMGMLK
jgi:hypothetical protein